MRSKTKRLSLASVEYKILGVPVNLSGTLSSICRAAWVMLFRVPTSQFLCCGFHMRRSLFLRGVACMRFGAQRYVCQDEHFAHGTGDVCFLGMHPPRRSPAQENKSLTRAALVGKRLRTYSTRVRMVYPNLGHLCTVSRPRLTDSWVR